MVGLQGINVKEELGSEHAKEWEGIWTGDERGEETTTRGGRKVAEEEERWEIDWTWRRR